MAPPTVMSAITHTVTAKPTQLPAETTSVLTWRSLAALGIVGGLVPSVSALVILLAAISLHRISFGLLLILARGTPSCIGDAEYVPELGATPTAAKVCGSGYSRPTR